MRQKLIDARLRMGWSQEKAAEQLDVARTTVHHWESGRKRPYPVHVQKLCMIYGLEVEDLEDGSALLSRRDVVSSLFGGAVAASQLSSIEGILSWGTLGIPALWQLHYKGETEHIGPLLPMFLASLQNASHIHSPYQKQALSLYSQAQQLHYEIAVDREDYQAALMSAIQAHLAAEAAENRPLQVAALIRRADCHFHKKEPYYALHAYQQALPLLQDSTPLLTGRVYAGMAEVAGMQNDLHIAEKAIALAHEHYPSTPQDDPAYAYTHFSHYSLHVFGTGQTRLFLGQPKAAAEAFDYAAQHLDLSREPLTRLDLLYYQAQASIVLKDRDQSAAYLTQAGEEAKALSSKLYLQKLREAYREARAVFPNEKTIESIAEVLR